MTFDPNKHIIQISGKDYLETKWRLVWFRDVHPDGSIDTALISETERGVTFKATVSYPWYQDNSTVAGYVTSTGWAFEPWDKKRIGSPHENGETSAIGRALAHMGYGTQFAPEMDMADERLVDSPVPPRAPQSSPRPQNAQPDVRPHEPAVLAPSPQSGSPGENANPATKPQIGKIFAEVRRLGWDEDHARAEMTNVTGKESTKDLNIAEATRFIDYLLKQKPQQQAQPALV